jgi:hypothetical protein
MQQGDAEHEVRRLVTTSIAVAVPTSRDSLPPTATPLGNIEVVARAICARLYARHWPPRPRTDADIERHWHVVAARLEAGLIDETGKDTGPFALEPDIAAYGDWHARHPDYVVPPFMLEPEVEAHPSRHPPLRHRHR